MQLKGAAIERFLDAPPASIRVALVYGPDSGLTRERAERLVRAAAGKVNDPFRVAELTGAMLKADPARLSDEAGQIPLMGGRRALRIRDAGEDVAAHLRALLASEIKSDALIVVEAGELGKQSGLRRLAEEQAQAAAIPCYLDDEAAVAEIVRRSLEAAGIKVEASAVAWLADQLGGDRGVTRSELAKLALYAGPGGTIDLAAARAVVGDAAALDLDDLAAAVAAGDRATLDRVMARLRSEGTSPVTVLRAVARHFIRLHAAASRWAGGGNPEEAVGSLRPPVFFKAQPAMVSALRLWAQGSGGASTRHLDRALSRLLETEVACKRTGAPAELLCARAMAELAAMARARSVRS